MEWTQIIKTFLEDKPECSELATNGTNSIFTREKGKRIEYKNAFKNEEDFKEYVNSNIESDKVEGVICLIEVPNAEQLMEKLQKTSSTYQINFETIEDEYSFSSKGEIELMFLG